MSFRKMEFGRYDYAAFITYFSYAAGSVVIPVALVNIARDLGFSLGEGGMTLGGILQLGRSSAVVLSMIVCGFIAARFGKRITLGVSLLLIALGLLLSAMAPAYGILIVALAIAGLGEGVVEGLATPFIQDLHDKDPGQYINFSHSFWSVGVFSVVLVSGYLVSIGVSWRIPVLMIVICLLFAALMLLINDSRYPYHDSMAFSSWQDTALEFKKIIQIPRFWTFFGAMFLAGGAEFCITFWVASYIQLSLMQTAWVAGLGTAVFALGMFLGRTMSGIYIKQDQLRNLVLSACVGGVFASLLLPLQNQLVPLFGVLLLCGLATAPLWPSIQSYSADCLPEVDTTALFILLSCAGIPGAGTFTWLMGYVGNAAGDLRMAFYLVPLCFTGLVLLLGLDGLKKRQQSVALADLEIR